MLSLTCPATSEARSQLQQLKARALWVWLSRKQMELTAWVERTKSERGVAIIGTFWGEVPTRLRAWARKDSSFTRYFPSKASRNLRYVLSQNIPEPVWFARLTLHHTSFFLWPTRLHFITETLSKTHWARKRFHSYRIRLNNDHDYLHYLNWYCMSSLCWCIWIFFCIFSHLKFALNKYF